jgi:hypothetical protein
MSGHGYAALDISNALCGSLKIMNTDEVILHRLLAILLNGSDFLTDEINVISISTFIDGLRNMHFGGEWRESISH